jgi:hypothetical protein
LNSRIGAVIAAVSVVAMVGGVVTPGPPGMALPAPTPVHLTAANSAPPGAIPLAFLRNQFQYCEVICPYMVQGVLEVPVAVAQAPAVFLDSLTTTGDVLSAVGAAAASVTGRISAAATPIIDNDVYRVVPKAFNTLEVALVEFVNVTSVILEPARFLPAVHTARANILAALNQPLPPPVPTETGARTLPQVLGVEAVKVFTAVVFQAGELLLLGVVQSADAAARELAESGDPVAAVRAGTSKAAESIGVAGEVVRDAVDTAVTNIRDALDQPFPASATNSTAVQRDSPSDVVKSDGAPVPGRSVNDRRTDDDPPVGDDAGRPQSVKRSSGEPVSAVSGSDTSDSDPSGPDSAAPPDAGSSDSATPSARKNAMNSGPPR